MDDLNQHARLQDLVKTARAQQSALEVDPVPVATQRYDTFGSPNYIAHGNTTPSPSPQHRAYDPQVSFQPHGGPNTIFDTAGVASQPAGGSAARVPFAERAPQAISSSDKSRFSVSRFTTVAILIFATITAIIVVYATKIISKFVRTEAPDLPGSAGSAKKRDFEKRNRRMRMVHFDESDDDDDIEAQTVPIKHKKSSRAPVPVRAVAKQRAPKESLNGDPNFRPIDAPHEDGKEEAKATVEP